MNAILKELYGADVADRSQHIPDDQLTERDRTRLVQVEQILREDHTLDARDYHHAALIYQHGETLEHYMRAHQLAVQAVELGDDTARWLAAATLDRSLVMQGKPQKFGTQFQLNDENQWQIVEPIDQTITDAERAQWDVPPLKDALQMYTQKYES